MHTCTLLVTAGIVVFLVSYFTCWVCVKAKPELIVLPPPEGIAVGIWSVFPRGVSVTYRNKAPVNTKYNEDSSTAVMDVIVKLDDYGSIWGCLMLSVPVLHLCFKLMSLA